MVASNLMVARYTVIYTCVYATLLGVSTHVDNSLWYPLVLHVSLGWWLEVDDKWHQGPVTMQEFQHLK